jgi:hypothetical protein
MENDSLGVSIIQTAKGVQIHYQTHSQKVKDGMAILISIPPSQIKKEMKWSRNRMAINRNSLRLALLERYISLLLIHERGHIYSLAFLGEKERISK